MGLKRKLGIPLAEFIEMNLEYFKGICIEIDGDWYNYGIGKGNFYLPPMYESLDDLVRESKSTEVFCDANYLVVKKIKQLRESKSVFITTEWAE